MYATFAVTTLLLQRKRKRRQADVNLRFWRAGMTLAIAAGVAWVVASAPVALPASFAVTVGVLAIVGAALSLLNGMLYRIVPFLAWFHLFSRAGASPAVPHLKQYLGAATQRRHFALHVASLALLLAASLRPHVFAHVAALAFAASALALRGRDTNCVRCGRVFAPRSLRVSSAVWFVASCHVDARRFRPSASRP